VSVLSGPQSSVCHPYWFYIVAVYFAIFLKGMYLSSKFNRISLKLLQHTFVTSEAQTYTCPNQFVLIHHVCSVVVSFIITQNWSVFNQTGLFMLNRKSYHIVITVIKVFNNSDMINQIRFSKKTKSNTALPLVCSVRKHSLQLSKICSQSAFVLSSTGCSNQFALG